MIVELISNMIGVFAELLLTRGTAIGTTISETTTKLSTIVDAYRLAVASILYPTLPIIGGKVAILATAVA